MATQQAITAWPEWSGHEQCPFCGDTLTDGGPAFIEHLRANQPCQAGFDAWRDRISGDMQSEWIG